MPLSIDYDCDRCHFHRTLTYLPRVYVLAADRALPMLQCHFWCPGCADIGVAEALEPGPEDIAAQAEELAVLRELASVTADELAALPPRPRHRARRAAERLAGLLELEADRQAWRARRRAPQRCLRCGRPTPLLPAGETESFEHGGCGGTLVCTATYGAVNTMAMHAHLYDVDGELLERGSRAWIDPATSAYTMVPLELFCGEDVKRAP